MKKLCTFAIALLAAAVCLFLLPTEAQAEELVDGYFTFEESGMDPETWEYLATITACDPSISGDITIPSVLTYVNTNEYGDEMRWPYRVVGIGSSAFSQCDNLTSVVIPEGVTEIGVHAFYGCDNIVSVDIPESVTSIDYGAFAYCKSLTDISIPDGVTKIRQYTFQQCSGLTEIHLPDSITSIDYNAFSGCSKLTSIDIPGGVTSIGSGAFRSCKGLTEIAIPEGVNSIAWETFYGCTGLTNIVIPDSVTEIGQYAFSACKGLTSISLPDSVTRIDGPAFDGCDEQIFQESDGAKYLGNPENPYMALISLSDKTATSYNLNPDTKVIAADAFEGCSNLTSITIPDGVAYIPYRAFSGCSNLTSVTMNNVKTIGGCAFADCVSLTELVIPEGAEVIMAAIFENCSSLESITIPESVTCIEWQIFDGCDSLTNIYYAGTEEQLAALGAETGFDIPSTVTVHYNATGPAMPEAELNVNRAIIRLQEQMKMGFYYEMATDATVLETGAIVWTAEEYAKETAFDVDHTVGKKYPGKAENTDGTYYSIETDGIPAQAIDTVLYILPYAKTANGYSYGETIKSNSILNVAKNQYNDAETTADVKAVIVDVLNYATAARNYFVAKGEMTAPAEAFNAILTDEEKALKWSDDLLAARSGVTETESEYAPATDKVYINIEDSLKIQFVFADTSVTGALYWQSEDYTGNTVHDSTTATGEADITVQNGYVSCAIRGINAYNIYDDFYVRGYNAQGQLTKTYTHSIAAYLTNQIAACEGKTDSESQVLVELCKAMLIYGKSAQENDAVNKGE